MRGMSFSFVAFFIYCVVVVVIYFLNGSDYLHWFLDVSNDSFADFGTYFAGVVSPFAAIFAGFLVYKSVMLNFYQKKIELVRESLERLDGTTQIALKKPVKNKCINEDFYGKPFVDIVYAISNDHLPKSEAIDTAIISMIGNMAILAGSVRSYFKLIENFPSGDDDVNWLRDLEHCYWVDRYSAICNRMVNIVGDEAVKKKCREHQLAGLEEVFLFRRL